MTLSRYQPPKTNPRSCRVCGCTDEAACFGGCAWTSSRDDLCTSCEAAKPHLVKQRVLGGRGAHILSTCRCGWSCDTPMAHHKKRAGLIRLHWREIVGVDA